MALSDLTREAVEAAMAEYNALGGEGFLRKYGYRPARVYFLVDDDGRRYPSKAIAGAAHGYITTGSSPLTAAEFSGGEKTVATKLRELDFEVIADANLRLVEAPFEVGEVYSRRNDIHSEFGGQEQGGISTPDGSPFIFLFTGEMGEQYGYDDGWSEGVFLYVGEGQRGQMEFVRGNKAIRDHAIDGKELLLFEALKRKGDHRYAGKFDCAGWHMRDARDADGAIRRVIVFELVPSDDAANMTDEIGQEPDLPLTTLRERALEAATATSVANVRDARKTYYRRSWLVKVYVWARAKGTCEACGQSAPFVRPDGTPYLEPHHTRRVSDGGPDDPRWVAAVCPNCHREIHHGQNGEELNRRLIIRLAELEADQ
jgi:5-methylcytosine-specific restriction enzyme A